MDIKDRGYTLTNEGYINMLDKAIKERGYLFGRMLACFEIWERQVLAENECTQSEILQAQYVGKFSRSPLTFLYKVEKASLINRSHLPFKIQTIFRKELCSIVHLFKENEYCDTKIGGGYILGFYQQKSFFEITYPDLKI